MPGRCRPVQPEACKQSFFGYAEVNEDSQEHEPNPLPDPTQGSEGLRWRSWPCPQCDGGIAPLSYILRRHGAGADVLPIVPEEVAALETKWLKEWVAGCPHNPVTHLFVPKLAEGSEHLVYFDADHARVIKVTRPHSFGQSYHLEGGRIHQKNCSPLEYLIRLRLCRKLFPVRQRYWLWKKAYDDFEMWVGDARADNFVQTDAGIVPIDIRLWFADKPD